MTIFRHGAFTFELLGVSGSILVSLGPFDACLAAKIVVIMMILVKNDIVEN